MEDKSTIRAIIETYNLDTKTLAEAMFPHHKHPVLALSRVISNSEEITLGQIKIIAEQAGILPKDLAWALIQTV